MAGGGVIGCGGPGGGGSNSWRGETYATITVGEVWLRAYCTLNLWDSITTQSVLTHELGHTLGLGHSDAGASPHDVCRGDEDAAQMRSLCSTGRRSAPTTRTPCAGSTVMPAIPARAAVPR